jgi:glyoxylase-like metal-dependent hydrolase (beta-lactamase superfamily II)
VWEYWAITLEPEKGGFRKMNLNLKTLLLTTATVACSWAGVMTGAKAESPPGMKLYVFSSGFLNIDKSALQAGAAPGKIDIPVGFFLIHHPKGNVLFDTGNNDRVISDPTYWGPLAAMLSNPANNSRSPDVAIDAQLEKAGYKISDINYVILGHMHLDHAGNVGKFPNATLVYQRDEIINALWPKPGYAGPYIPGDLAGLRAPVGSNLPAKQKVIELDGDLDLFGDGSILTCLIQRIAAIRKPNALNPRIDPVSPPPCSPDRREFYNVRTVWPEKPPAVRLSRR